MTVYLNSYDWKVKSNGKIKEKVWTKKNHEIFGVRIGT